MYGKHFASMYEGSMRGAGSAFFAVWGYVISHALPNPTFHYASTVELNPEIVAFLIGEETGVVLDQIKKMLAPDPKSRTKDEEGRKLIKVGEYTYRVVNGDMYRKIRNEQERREYQRIKQAEYRARKKGEVAPRNSPGHTERGFEKGVGDGTIDPNTHERIVGGNSEVVESSQV